MIWTSFGSKGIHPWRQLCNQSAIYTPTYVSAGIVSHSNHETNSIIEFTLKNHSRICITVMCLPVFTIYGHFNHKANITIEFTLKKLLQKMYNTCVFAIKLWLPTSWESELSLQEILSTWIECIDRVMALPYCKKVMVINWPFVTASEQHGGRFSRFGAAVWHFNS